MSTPIILDANSLCKRCIMASAMDDLKAGITPTGGVFGTISSLASMLREWRTMGIQAGPIFAAFDNGVPPERLKVLPGYKGERKEKRKLLTDEEHDRVFAQMELCVEAFTLLGLTVVAYKDREADDTVAAMAVCLRKHNPIIVSSDRDLLQTVAWGHRTWVIGKNVMVEPENFEAYAGVPARYYLVYKALVGDPSDSIRGADGCGETRAAELVRRFVQAEPDTWKLWPPEPREALTAMCKMLAADEASGRKLLKWEQGILDDEERLQRVIRGIDLHRSFGGTKGLCQKLSGTAKCDHWGFIGMAKRLQFESFRGAPDTYILPFVRAAKFYPVVL